MRTLEELAKDVDIDDDVARDLIAHVQQQAEQIATLTARVAALEASEAERAIDRMVARRTGPGRPMKSAGQVQTPAKLDEAPAAPPSPAAPAPASDDYEARAKEMVTAWERSAGTGLPSLEERIATLLRTVADEARREERAACEAVCREVAEECRPHSQIKTHVATVCADRIAARGKGE